MLLVWCAYIHVDCDQKTAVGQFFQRYHGMSSAVFSICDSWTVDLSALLRKQNVLF